MKLFGHPLHLMLIHFPSALFPMDLICSCISFYDESIILTQSSLIMMLGGTLFGWIAVITGTFDLLTVMKNKPGAIKKALLHGGINTSILLAYTVLSFLAIRGNLNPGETGSVILVFKFLLVCIMLVGNYIGGSLVLKHKVLDRKTS
ncbi:MAG: DUF2231 domain-containing protein [Bacteroidia bacterium]|nr:DUF2231 domain-containing protein [Bacteroidia bacterium]